MYKIIALSVISLYCLSTVTGYTCVRFGKRSDDGVVDTDSEGMVSEGYAPNKKGYFLDAPDGAIQCFKVPFFPKICTEMNSRHQEAKGRYSCCQVRDTGIILPSWKCVQLKFVERDNCDSECFTTTTDYEPDSALTVASIGRKIMRY